MNSDLKEVVKKIGFQDLYTWRELAVILGVSAFSVRNNKTLNKKDEVVITEWHKHPRLPIDYLVRLAQRKHHRERHGERLRQFFKLAYEYGGDDNITPRQLRILKEAFGENSSEWA